MVTLFSLFIIALYFSGIVLIEPETVVKVSVPLYAFVKVADFLLYGDKFQWQSVRGDRDNYRFFVEKPFKFVDIVAILYIILFDIIFSVFFLAVFLPFMLLGIIHFLV